jgi:Spy/CpxP family protein refolding chaperone
MKITFLSLSFLACGVAFAQQPQATQQTNQQGTGRRGHMGPRETPEQAELRSEQRIAQHLGLSAAQQNSLHTTRADARVQTNGMNDKMHTLHTSLNAAIKSGNEGQIDTISQEIATVHQQQTAIHAKTTAKIYSSLTADQKTKVGENLGMLGGGGPGFGPGFGRGPGGPRGRGPGPAKTPAPQQ